MNEAEFWNLIAAAKQESKGNPERQVELLQRTLERQTEADILDFDRLLQEQLTRSYTLDLWAAAYIINGGCSDDGFDYFRAWLIAQGREVFQNALQDPETLVDVAEADAELELFLYVAIEAFEKKTKTKFTYTSRPRRELTGDEWEEDEEALQAKYPKLFAQFWNSAAEEKTTNAAEGLAPVADFLNALMSRDQSGVNPAEALYHEAVLGSMIETPDSLAKSAELLTKAAEQGHANAQYLLGTCYQLGRGVKQSYPKAAKLYRQSAENGNADACGDLASLYYSGLELDQDYAAAFKWYKRGAELGSADAEYGLGLLYSEGAGVEKDLSESLKWFHRGAQNGSERAALNVGLIYINGIGVEADAAEAAKWFAQAAEGGSVQAEFNLAVLYEKGRGVEQDLARAVELYQSTADQDNSKAMINLGMLYSNGTGVPQDYAKAAELYQRAVDAGSPSAASNLAVLYQHGRGVPKDEAEALRLYRLSVDAGIAVGQFNLGTMYHRGIGVAKDDVEAVRWYRLAAAQNHPAALNNIADAYENGYGVAQDFAEAVKWYQLAAERGVSASHYSLGLLYRDGRGVKQDYQAAEKHLSTAVALGFEKAKVDLDALYEAGHVKRAETVVVQGKKSKIRATIKTNSAPAQKIVSAQSAAQRALCLRALYVRSEIEVLFAAIGQKLKTANKSKLAEVQAETRRMNDWLKDEELWLAASDDEKKLLTAAPGSWPASAIKAASWRAEALGVIGWALGLANEILPYDAQLDESLSVRGIQILTPAKPRVASARLRPEKEILEAREIAENWLWRARTTQIQKEPDKYPPPAGWTYEKIIAKAAGHWEKAGLFKAVRGDYPVRGKAYSELTEDEWQELRSIAVERLYGLNWLCKYSANWDLVPTGT